MSVLAVRRRFAALVSVQSDDSETSWTRRLYFSTNIQAASHADGVGIVFLFFSGVMTVLAAAKAPSITAEVIIY